MSKFKSFAQQGSFSDYQIQAPDQTGKIEQETARTIRGKERAQRFLETNQAAFLQAKKQAQNIEAAQREENFNLQTQERQAYKDALDRDYQIRTQNDRSKAQADAANFRNIQQFSQTAAQLYGEYQKQDLKRNQEKNAALAYAAGADYKTVVAIQSLGDNLSKSEFAQTEFIRKKMEEGVSIDALFALYERRASKAFINNIGVAQNTAYAYEQAANLEIERFRREKPDATTEEQRRNLQIFEANYAASFVGVDGRGLNADLLNQYVYPIMRRSQTSFNSAFEQQIAKERKATIEQDMFKQLNYAWTTGKSTGVAQWLSTNPSKAKFETYSKWVKNKSLDFTQTGLSSRDMDDLYDIGFSGVNGKQTTYGLSRGSLPDGAVFNEARNTRKRAEIQFTRAGREERENNAQAMAIDLYNQRAADGSISREDLAESQELDRKSGIPGFVSKGTEQMAKELDSVRYEAAYTQLFDDKLNKGTLTLQDLEQKGVSFALKQKYAPLVKQQNVLLQDKSYKDGVTTISNAITEYSLVAEGRVGNKDHYTTVLFKTDQLQQFQDDVLVKKIPIQDAVSGRLGIIAAKQAAPGAINQYGHYTEMVQSQAQGAVNYQEALKRDKDFIETSQTPNFRKDAAVAVNSYGQDNFYKDYYPMQEER